MSLDMEQFHESFFDESAEHLDDMERLLMALNLEQPDPDDLDSIFRAAHSIKGGSGIFGFEALGAVTHVMENLAVPTYEQDNELHQRIVAHAHAARESALEGEAVELEEIELELDQAAAELWGLTSKELEAVRDALGVKPPGTAPLLG